MAYQSIPPDGNEYHDRNHPPSWTRSPLARNPVSAVPAQSRTCLAMSDSPVRSKTRKQLRTDLKKVLSGPTLESPKGIIPSADPMTSKIKNP